MFNLWRSTDLKHDIEVMPLAVLDMTTLDFDDMVAADAWGGVQAVQQHLVSYRLAFNEYHRWYYYPKMTPREMLIFKQYDTREENPCLRQVYHGAIQDPIHSRGGTASSNDRGTGAGTVRQGTGS